jgi:3-keto-disaccharide hydrolase
MYALALLVLAAAADGRSALESQPRGWVDILPGPGLAGWSRVAPVSTAGVKSRVDPQLEVWVVDRKTGVLDCRGDLPPAPPGGKDGSHEMLRYDRELGDFIFHVEWRFTDPQRPGWNAGVYARTNRQASVWHQAQVGGPAAGYWFGDTLDESGKIVRRKVEAREPRVRPPGQWNTYEITGRGSELQLWVNGAVVAEWKDLRVPRGHVGLEAELHHIEFRNLKLKPLGR